MLRVKTQLKQSSIHAIGLFADQIIPKGTITWQRDPDLDITLPEDFLTKVPNEVKQDLLGWVYYDYSIQKYVLCADNQRFINHSTDNYNIVSEPDFDVAGRNIEIGEELLCNYNHYEKDWFSRRGVSERDFK